MALVRVAPLAPLQGCFARTRVAVWWCAAQLDVAFLPIGGTFTMNIAEAAEAAAVINADIAIPIHFLAADPVDFMNLVTAKGYVVRVLNTGETIEL